MTQLTPITVQPVTDRACFEACLRLRYDTYRSLGYIQHHDSGIDLDQFDWSSFQFVAYDDSRSTVGTVRLTVPRPSRLPAVPELDATGSWCSQIAVRHGLKVARSPSIPIIETLRENE